MKIVLYALAGFISLHGLVHLMGFIAYWPLAELAELPYKTAIADGRWEVGRTGMRLFGALWLLAGLGFVAAAVGFLTGQDWWRLATVATLALSSVVIALDWAPAFRGAVVNGVILVLLLLAYWMPDALTHR